MKRHLAGFERLDLHCAFRPCDADAPARKTQWVDMVAAYRGGELRILKNRQLVVVKSITGRTRRLRVRMHRSRLAQNRNHGVDEVTAKLEHTRTGIIAQNVALAF